MPLSLAQALLKHIEASSGDLAQGDSLGTLDSLRAESGSGKATVSEAVRIVIDRGPESHHS